MKQTSLRAITGRVPGTQATPRDSQAEQHQHDGQVEAKRTWWRTPRGTPRTARRRRQPLVASHTGPMLRRERPFALVFEPARGTGAHAQVRPSAQEYPRRSARRSERTKDCKARSWLFPTLAAAICIIGGAAIGGGIADEGPA